MNELGMLCQVSSRASKVSLESPKPSELPTPQQIWFAFDDFDWSTSELPPSLLQMRKTTNDNNNGKIQIQILSLTCLTFCCAPIIAEDMNEHYEKFATLLSYLVTAETWEKFLSFIAKQISLTSPRISQQPPTPSTSKKKKEKTQTYWEKGTGFGHGNIPNQSNEQDREMTQNLLKRKGKPTEKKKRKFQFFVANFYLFQTK